MKRNRIIILTAFVISFCAVLLVIYYHSLLLGQPDFVMSVDVEEEIRNITMTRGEERWFNVTIKANQNLNGTLRIIISYSPASVALWSEIHPSSRLDLRPNEEATFMVKVGVYPDAEPQTAVIEIEGNIQSLLLQRWCFIHLEIN